MLCLAGATSPYCLSLLNAITVTGTDITNFFFSSNCPKTERICSMRSATSRPRFSPASVPTRKCEVCTSIHFVSSLAKDGCAEKAVINRQVRQAPRCKEVFTTVALRRSFRENASTTQGVLPYLHLSSLAFIVSATIMLHLEKRAEFRTSWCENLRLGKRRSSSPGEVIT